MSFVADLHLLRRAGEGFVALVKREWSALIVITSAQCNVEETIPYTVTEQRQLCDLRGRQLVALTILR